MVDAGFKETKVIGQDAGTGRVLGEYTRVGGARAKKSGIEGQCHAPLVQ